MIRDCRPTQRDASQEDYGSLTIKTLSFLRTAVAAWDAEYIVKVRAAYAEGPHCHATAFAQALLECGLREGLCGCRWMMMYTCAYRI